MPYVVTREEIAPRHIAGDIAFHVLLNGAEVVGRQGVFQMYGFFRNIRDMINR